MACLAGHRITPSERRVPNPLMEEEMTPDEITAWAVRHRLKAGAAAHALGITTRAWHYYRHGLRPIPECVDIICRYYDRHGPLEGKEDGL